MKKPVFFKTFFKIFISFAVLALLISHLESERFIETLKQVSMWQLGMGTVFYLFAQFISTIRWQQLAVTMRLEGNLFQFYRYYLIGMFFSLFLPTAIGGDVGRAILFSKETACKWLQAFLSILSERLCGLAGLMLYVVIGFTWIHPPQWSLLSLSILSFFTLASLVFIFGFRWIEHYKWGKWFIHRFILKTGDSSEDPGEIWPSSKAIFQGLLVSMVFHACIIGIQMLILFQLNIDVSFMLVATVYGLSGLAGMIPVSLNGIGLREGAATTLLMIWGGVAKEEALAFSLVWLSIILLAAIPGGLIILKQQLMFTSRKKI